MTIKSCQIEWLGRLDYGITWELQKELAAKRAEDQIPDTLLLLEHPPTYTIGIDGHREQLLLNKEELSQRNIACYRVDRGGDIIYHGPGQLVVYPILNLKMYGCNYHSYIDMLVRVITQTLAHFRIRAFRKQGQPGILTFCDPLPGPASRWAQSDSCAAIIATVGIKLDISQITSHGFCINVNPNLEYFDLIIPSNLQGCSTTSLHQVLNKSIEIGSVLEAVIQSFCHVFEVKPIISYAALAALPEWEYSVREEDLLSDKVNQPQRHWHRNRTTAAQTRLD